MKNTLGAKYELQNELVDETDKNPINAFVNRDETNHCNFVIALYKGLFEATCDKCHIKNLNEDNYCDFCDRTLCDNCLPDEISFHKCDTCGTRWCYNATKYINNYCERNTGQDDTCPDCGH